MLSDRLMIFGKVLEANSIPHVSIRLPGSGTPIDFAESVTKEQVELGLRLYAEFDWSDPQPLKSLDEIKMAYLGSAGTPEERQILWDSMLAGILLWFTATYPDTMQEILDGIGVPFKVRKDK